MRSFRGRRVKSAKAANENVRARVYAKNPENAFVERARRPFSNVVRRERKKISARVRTYRLAAVLVRLLGERGLLGPRRAPLRGFG